MKLVAGGEDIATDKVDMIQIVLNCRMNLQGNYEMVINLYKGSELFHKLNVIDHSFERLEFEVKMFRYVFDLLEIKHGTLFI